MDTLLPITPDVLKSLLASDDLTNDFITNNEYSKSTIVPFSQQTDTDRTNINIINVAKVLLSYYMSMNKVNDKLSEYSSMLENKENKLSTEKKADIELRVKLLTYVVSQKYMLDNFDKVNNELQEYKNKEVSKSGKRKSKKKSTKRNIKKQKKYNRNRTKRVKKY
jgi:hypothetical protein